MTVIPLGDSVILQKIKYSSLYIYFLMYACRQCMYVNTKHSLHPTKSFWGDFASRCYRQPANVWGDPNWPLGGLARWQGDQRRKWRRTGWLLPGWRHWRGYAFERRGECESDLTSCPTDWEGKGTKYNTVIGKPGNDSNSNCVNGFVCID